MVLMAESVLWVRTALDSWTVVQTRCTRPAPVVVALLVRCRIYRPYLAVAALATSWTESQPRQHTRRPHPQACNVPLMESGSCCPWPRAATRRSSAAGNDHWDRRRRETGHELRGNREAPCFAPSAPKCPSARSTAGDLAGRLWRSARAAAA